MQVAQQVSRGLCSLEVLNRHKSPAMRSMPARGRAGRLARICCLASANNVGRPVVLPDGNWWFMESSDSDSNIYGTSWVMQGHYTTKQARSTLRQQQMHGQLALRRTSPTGVTLRQPQAPTDIVPLSTEEVEVSVVVLPPSKQCNSSTGIMPFRQMLLEAGSSDNVPEQGTSDSVYSSSSTVAIVPRNSSTMLGVVVSSAIRPRTDDVQLPMNNDSVYETFNTKHPRRTMKIKFTCKRCGATTIKPVNPHAWTAGSVFARCGCCNITHKLVDNLKLFHELAGPVFNAPITPRHVSSCSGGLDSGFDSSTARNSDDEGRQAADLPELPPRLRLKLPQWPFDSSDSSLFN